LNSEVRHISPSSETKVHSVEKNANVEVKKKRRHEKKKKKAETKVHPKS